MTDVYDVEALRPGGAMKVAVTGAAGQIGYSLLPLICSGRMFGKHQRVELRLLEITPAMGALEGVVMELEDCAFPLLENTVATDDALVAFKDVDVAVLVGAFPRKAGMERKELMSKNGSIFKEQGEAINSVASEDVKVVVVGNPANTNANILSQFAPRVPKQNITAMTRLDHNRLVGMVATKLDKSVTDISGVVIWGNHSSTQYPDVLNASVAGVDGSVREALGGEEWLASELIPAVQKRGAAIIAARKLSSAMSAANAACDHVRDWLLGSGDRIVSMAVPADGSYNIADGIWFSFPVRTTRGGKYEIQKDMMIDAFSQERINITEKELREEREDALAMIGNQQ